MDIVIVHGVVSPRGHNPLPHLAKGFKKAFPTAQIHFEHRLYAPWSTGTMLRLIAHIRAKYQKSDSVMLVGHSLGGIVALAAAREMHNACAVVTIFSPHTAYHSLFSQMLLSESHNERFIIISFGALRDRVVPHSGTMHPRAKYHGVIDTDHVAGLARDVRITDEIAHTVRTVLSEPDD